MDLDLDLKNYRLESYFLYYLRLIEHVFAPFLWIMAIYFGISLPRISLVHKNLRIILSFSPIAALTCTSSHLVFIHLIKWAEESQRQTDWITEVLYCVVCFIHLGSSAFSASMMFGVVLERLRASIKHQNYESSGIKFGILLCAQSLISGILFALFIMSYDILNVSKDDPFYKYRYSFELHPFLGLICYGCAAISTVCSALLMYRLYLRNKMLNLRTRGVVPLTDRYQYNENVQSLRTLTPIMCMYGLCTVGGSVLVVYRQMRFNKTGPDDLLQMIYLQLVYMSMDLFVLVGVPFIFSNYHPLKNILRSDFNSLFGNICGMEQKQIRVVTSERFYQKHAPKDGGGDIYFRQLKESWM